MSCKSFPKGRTVFVGVDPAGLNAIYAVICGLRRRGWPKKDAVCYTDDSGCLSAPLRPYAKRMSFSPVAVRRVLSVRKPALLFLGTSARNREAVWIGQAKALGIRTVSFIDHWVNMRARFESCGRCVFPDQVWVVNDQARRQAVREGVPSGLIKVVRNPYYELIENYRPAMPKALFKRSLGLKPFRTILFVSDCVRDTLPDIGFDELSVLSAVLKELRALQAEAGGEGYNFLIRPHPRCNKGKYHGILREYASEKLAIKEVPGIDPNLLNYHSDFVIGMFSNMVAEAMLMGKKVLRVEPGRKAELLKFDEARCRVVTRARELKKELRRFLGS